MHSWKVVSTDYSTVYTELYDVQDVQLCAAVYVSIETDVAGRGRAVRGPRCGAQVLLQVGWLVRCEVDGAWLVMGGSTVCTAVSKWAACWWYRRCRGAGRAAATQVSGEAPSWGELTCTFLHTVRASKGTGTTIVLCSTRRLSTVGVPRGGIL